MSERVDWSALADLYDAATGEDGHLWHRELIIPPLLELLGDLDGLDVLDLACGNGYLSRRFARQGARITGVDRSGPVLEHARQRTRAAALTIDFHHLDAERLDTFGDQSFDVVYCNMALMDMARADLVIGEVARTLRPGGRFIFSITHPCFEIPDASGWVLEKPYSQPRVLYRKISRYREVFTGAFHWNLKPEQRVETNAYHRPLNWYFRALRAARFAVTAFEEPEPSQAFVDEEDQGEWIREIPLHCVIEARKFSE